MAPTNTLFTVQNGRFCYGKSVIFKDLNFELYPGKFYGLIGPNGSGKSTLIDILMSMNQLERGTITYLSQPLSSYNKREIAKHLSLVPQHFSIGFEFSVKDIVLMGRHPHIARFSPPSQKDLDIVEESLHLLDISHLRDRNVTQLSGGERQRVVVARALAQQTKVLMLDEATANLDIEHTLTIMRILKKRVRENSVTIIAAIHDLNIASAFCDQLIVLKKHQLYTIGKVDEIITPQLIESVFSVDCTVSSNKGYPSILYRMHGD